MKKIRSAMVLALVLVLSLVSCATTKDQGIVSGVKLDKYNIYMYAPDTIQLQATVNGTCTNKDVVWESSDPAVVQVSQDGVLTLVDGADGTKTVSIYAISAQDPSKKGTASVTVFPGNQINLLMAGPGHDSSTSQTISWHSSNEGCVLELTAPDGSEFVTEVSASCEKSTINWTDFTQFYRYRVELEDLVPGSTYQYRVRLADGSVSEAGTFRTADADGSFDFLWISDNHTQANNPLIYNVDKSVSRANAFNGDDMEFVLFSGDMVNKGQIYNNWFNWNNLESLKSLTFALEVGNHEYYPSGAKKMDTSDYYLDMVAIPQDPDSPVLASNYWFRYENVLFICLDSIGREDDGTKNYANKETLAEDAAWLESVIQANEGTYDYLIVTQHYSMLEGENEGTGAYSFWYPYMDKYNVDLVLASDTHTYSRSYPLYGDQVTEGGTVYMTSPITEYQEEKAIVNNPDLTGTRCAFFVGEKGSGFTVVNVTPENITLHVFGSDNIEYDTVTVEKKSR